MIKQTSSGNWVICGDTHISKWVEDSGRLDHDQSALPIILSQIPSSGTVIDVGAFIGDHTSAYLRRVGPLGRVYAFEPNPVAFSCLIRNCPKAICVNAALSCFTTTCRLIEDANVGASYVVNEAGVITAFQLDVFGFERVDLIKIDVEGFEIDVLHGAVRTIDKHKPTLVVEVNPGALKRRGGNVKILIEKIESLGYDWNPLFSNQSITDAQLDIICKPKP